MAFYPLIEKSIETRWPLFRLFSSFQTNFTIFTTNKCEKMSIQYTVLGFEPTIFGTQVSSRPKLIFLSIFICRYLQTYPAHNTPIYNIAWNTYVSSIFLTCAAEWMIKIWDHTATKPLFMFDLNAQVGDVAWAPYSREEYNKTVFTLTDGCLEIYGKTIGLYFNYFLILHSD